jgi:hypothetical protein
MPKEAETRARELLLSKLSPEQRKTFEEHKWFIVKGGRSGLSYRIKDQGNVVANVDLLAPGADDHRASAAYRLCAHPDPARYPLGDHLLSQKIMLELAEDEFLRVANRHAA